jgi:uncharacterized protein (DUF305 family)
MNSDNASIKNDIVPDHKLDSSDKSLMFFNPHRATNYSNTPKIFLGLLVVMLIIVIVSAILLASWAFLQNSIHSSGSNSSQNSVMSTNQTNTTMMLASSQTTGIGDAKTYMEVMVPNLQEAVDTSIVILGRTQNQDLKNIAQKIIEIDTSQISQMKIWYKSWYNSDFPTTVSNFQPTISSLSQYSGTDLDSAYSGFMWSHSQDIVQLSKNSTVATPTELKDMIQTIINTQNDQIDTLTKFTAK